MTTCIRLVAGLLAAFIITSCAAAPAGRPGRRRGATGPQPVPVATAHPATIHPSLAISGLVAPYQNIAISASLNEPVTTVLVNEGDRVRAGQPLAQQDTADLQATLAADRAAIDVAARNASAADARVAQSRYQARLNIGQGGDQVSAARATVSQARQTLAQGESDLARYRQLVGNGYIPQQQLSQQVTTVQNEAAALRNAQASLQSAATNQSVNGNANSGLQAANVASALADARSAHAQVGQATSQAQGVLTQIARARIVSPVDGVIVNRNLNPGEYPGSRTVFTIQQINSVYAELNASSSDTFRIRNGAPVSVTASGTDRRYTGSVVAVLGQVAPGATNFTVKALVRNPDFQLKAGIPVTGTIDLATISGIGIPSTAFLDDSHQSVMLARSGTARTVRVSERATDGTTSIVTGIPEGAAVIANGQLGLTQGQPVKVSER